ncbi:MAG: YncE family protein [Flavobacteriia bacterium]|nr:YncE family protein [Flavobacteriia bacterium]
MRYIKLFIIVFLAVSCKKHKVETPDSTAISGLKNGMLVLCEGLFQQNNATLSWIDLSNNTIDNDFFTTKNSRNLGDTGNDIAQYGSKIYIVVNVSSTLEVLDKNTGKSIKQISMLNGNTSKQPRYITFNGSNAFVTCYDGYVDVLDTASLTITQRIKVGDNPEQMAISNNKLYVANSGGLNSPNVDSTVSVIGLSNLQELYKITVGKNPGSVKVDNQGDIYVITRGNYSTIPSRMVRINTQTDQVAQNFSFDASGIEKMGNKFLINFYNYSNSTSNIALFNTENEAIEINNFISTSNITTLYGVVYRSSNNKIYCLDAMSFTNTGYVRVFSGSGIYETSYHVGLNPNNILFYE